ncbi:MAG: PD-(D/E)XK nuclease family transposase [Pirellulales bacterium]
MRCRDSVGRWFNVEMQVTAHRDILKRLTFYVCSMFTEQVREGDQYSQLQPAISICLLKDLLSQIEKWAFLLMYAQDYTAEHLKKLLPEDEFSGAIQTIEVISAKKEDREMYEQRSKAQRDYE